MIVKKAYQPTYFGGSVPTERLQAQRQRVNTEGQRMALQAGGAAAAGGSAAALGARLLGHDAAPAAVRAAGAYARKQGVPKATVKDLTHRADQAHTWAHKRKGRLLAASVGLAGVSAAARAGARWKKDEVTGISQDLGRATAGDRLQRGSRRFSKSIGTAIIGSYGMKAAKKWGELSPEARSKIVRGTVVGTTATGLTAGTAAGVARGDRWHRENKKLRRAGGVAGPVMKSEGAGRGRIIKAHSLIAGTNVTGYGYAYLPENIRTDVGYGSILRRRNPMSPLDLFAASRVMERSRGRGTRNAVNYAGARAMLYSPTGRGAIF